jgi:hypothetical protein
MESNVTTYSRESFIKLLSDPSKVDAFMALFNSAALIVGDFDDYGEVLQSNEAGMYDETTNIEKLRGAINLISPGMVPEGDYLPHLTEQQQKRLEEVAAEVVAIGDGVETKPIEDAASEVETMTPRERLEATGYWASTEDRQRSLRKRLGFDPENGEEFKD